MTIMPMQRGGVFGLPQFPQQYPEQGEFPAGGQTPFPQQAPQTPSRWLDGGKFTGKDALGLALGAIGDAFTRSDNTQNMVAGAFEQQRRQKLIAQQAQLRRQQEWEDWVAKEQYKSLHHRADPYRFEDNAGNVYERGEDGQNRLIFTDPNDKQFVVDGQLVTVPNAVRAQSQPSSPPVLDNLPPNAKPIGGASASASPPFTPQLPGGSFPRRR